jgi:glutaredoxin 3
VVRCEQHDLAAGPDGLCVVCRRGASIAPTPAQSDVAETNRRVFVGIAVALIVVVSGGLTYRVIRDRAILAEAEAKTPPAPTAAATAVAGGVRVIVYTTSWCPHCKRAKTWMTARNIPFEERDVEASREYASQLRALTGKGSIPAFDVDGQVSVGFNETELLAMYQRAVARKAPR